MKRKITTAWFWIAYIIAILLVMATRYFIAANESQKVNNAVSMIHGIVGGAANYKIANNGSYVNMSITNLVNGKYIPENFGGSDKNGTGANPWGGSLAVSGASATGFNVVMSGLSSDAVCTKVMGIMNGADGSSASCQGTALTVAFH